MDKRRIFGEVFSERSFEVIIITKFGSYYHYEVLKLLSGWSLEVIIRTKFGSYYHNEVLQLLSGWSLEVIIRTGNFINECSQRRWAVNIIMSLNSPLICIMSLNTAIRDLKGYIRSQMGLLGLKLVYWVSNKSIVS